MTDSTSPQINTAAVSFITLENPGVYGNVTNAAVKFHPVGAIQLPVANDQRVPRTPANGMFFFSANTNSAQLGSGNNWLHVLTSDHDFRRKINVFTPNVAYCNIDSNSTIWIINKLATANNTGSPTLVYMPNVANSSNVDIYTIKDGRGDASINKITIQALANTTIDGQQNAYIQIDYGAVDVVFNGTQWNLI